MPSRTHQGILEMDRGLRNVIPSRRYLVSGGMIRADSKTSSASVIAMLCGGVYVMSESASDLSEPALMVRASCIRIRTVRRRCGISG